MDLREAREHAGLIILIEIGAVALLLVLGEWLRRRWAINMLRNYLNARRRLRQERRNSPDEHQAGSD